MISLQIQKTHQNDKLKKTHQNDKLKLIIYDKKKCKILTSENLELSNLLAL